MADLISLGESHLEDKGSCMYVSYLNCSKAFEVIFCTDFFKKKYAPNPLNRC